MDVLGANFENFLAHYGHKLGVRADGVHASIDCLDCRLVLAEVAKDDDDFTYGRWATHADAVADAMSQAEYDALEPEGILPDHWVVCAAYGDAADPVNVAIECERCYEVLTDRDRDADEEEQS